VTLDDQPGRPACRPACLPCDAAIALGSHDLGVPAYSDSLTSRRLG
jgi:hypothetical protein